MIEQIKYSNKYGTLTLDIIGEYRDIKGFRVANVPDEYKFDIETSEKIALITENKGVQLSPSISDLNVWAVIHHKSSSVIALCGISELTYLSDKKPEQNIIDEYRPLTSFQMIQLLSLKK